MNAAEIARRGGLAADQAAVLGRYADMILKWGRVQSLTSLRDPDAIAARHLLDAMPLVRALPADVGHVADIGSGAGSPGIPVAVCRPQTRVTLVESRRKRAVFLRQCRIDLGLDNVEVRHGRAEDWRPRPAPDVLVSRATAPLDRLARMTAHLFGPATRMLVFKGNDLEEEVARLGDGSPVAVDRVDPVEGGAGFLVWLEARAAC